MAGTRMCNIIVASAVVLAATGCCSKYVPKLEPLIKLPKQSQQEDSLGCFWRMLRDFGVKKPHLVKIDPDLSNLTFISFDGSKKIYVFDGNKLKQEIEVDIPTRFRMMDVQLGNKVGIVIVPNQTTEKDLAITAVLVDPKSEGITKIKIDISGLVEKHGGILDPIVIGTDLERGINFSARDSRGEPWRQLYNISVKNGKVTINEINDRVLYSCSCYSEWLVLGVDSRRSTNPFYDTVYEMLDEISGSCEKEGRTL